jgi:hypothetical protein
VRYLSLVEVLLLHRLVMEQGRQQPLLQVASGDLDRAGLQAWLAAHEAPA